MKSSAAVPICPPTTADRTEPTLSAGGAESLHPKEATAPRPMPARSRATRFISKSVRDRDARHRAPQDARLLVDLHRVAGAGRRALRAGDLVAAGDEHVTALG